RGRADRHREAAAFQPGRSHASPCGRARNFAAGHSQLNRVEEAIGACEIEGVPAWVVADFIRTSIAKPDFDAFGGRPMLVFRSTPDVSWTLLIKNIIDRMGAFIGLLLASPLILG